MRKRDKLRRLVVAVGATGLGGVGIVYMWETAAVVISGVVLLAVLGITSAAVFSSRPEPSQRLLELIRALWR
jgi:hypothetical protein